VFLHIIDGKSGSFQQFGPGKSNKNPQTSDDNNNNNNNNQGGKWQRNGA